MPLNDFLPFALGAGSNVMSQAEYDALAARASGFSSGTAKSRELNKVWRQSAFAVSCIAQFMADYTGSDILDDGDSAAFKASLAKAISLLSMGTDYAVGANTGNAYTASFTPAVTGLVDGMVLRFKAATANTGAATFSPDGLTAKPIVNLRYAALSAGDISAGGEVWLQYNANIGGGSWVSILSLGLSVATTAQAGIVRLATNEESQAGIDSSKVITPASLAARTATESRSGLVELATVGEVEAGTDASLAVTPAGIKSAYAQKFTMIVADEKASGAGGGNNAIGDNTRTLNTVRTNTITGASLASNQITLPAGTYHIEASAPFFGGDRHRAFLYNVTDMSVAILGTNENGGAALTTRSFVRGVITIAATKVFELRQYFENVATNGFGDSIADGRNGVFAVMEIRKEA